MKNKKWLTFCLMIASFMIVLSACTKKDDKSENHEEDNKHVHVYGSEYYTDENNHWQICSCGETGNYGSHNFGDWFVTSEPTEETEGIQLHICDTCEFLQSATIAKLDHSYVDGICQYCDRDEYGNLFEFKKLRNGTYQISGVTELKANTIVIPKKYKGSVVSEISDYAFQNQIDITSVVIQDGATIIEDYAFEGCINLSSVTISESVTTIGISAFAGCSSLTNVTLPASITIIEQSAFEDCNNLESITLPFVGGSVETTTHTYLGYIFGASSYVDNLNYVPSSLTSVTVTDCSKIDNYAFSSCQSLVNITLPKVMTSIGHHAFKGCSSLKNIVIPDGITNIETSLFEDCSSLTTIDFSDDVNTIGANAFYNCSNLVNIGIPESVTSIGKNAFVNCTKLKLINIPQGIASIEDKTFYYCSSLTSIEIPEGVTNIGDSAFYCCSNLTQVRIPDTISSICANSFGGCINLDYNIYDNGLYLGNESTPYLLFISANSQTIQSIDIYENVKFILPYAFYGCKNLLNVTIPDGITYIGEETFYGCSSLNSVTIPNSVTSIGENAFYDCSSLKNIVIPDSVTSLSYKAFKGCNSLETMTLPFENVSYFGYLFGASSYSKNPECVPTSLKKVTITSASKINSNAFYKCSGIETVELPNGLTSINSEAFYLCTNLNNVIIPNGATFIGKSAFYGCTDLTKITLPASIETISNSAFLGCDYLSKVFYGGTVEEWKNIDISAFNSDLKSADITYEFEY